MRPVVPLLPLLASLAAGCAVFDGPPEATIQGLSEGLLPDAHAPVVLVFDKPPVPSTMTLEIAPYVVDTEGNLGDEGGNTTGLNPFFIHDPVFGDTGGTDVLSADGTTLTITPSAPFPVGPQLVVVIEPGLADAAGTVTKVRRRLVFSYSGLLTCDAPAHAFQSGTYFFLVDVVQPINVQIQLFGQVDLDSATGAFNGQFTKAKRNPDPSRCTPACPSTDVCRLLPTQACVIPSTVAGSVDEFSDYVPNPDAPTGFSFSASGCAVDQAAMTAAFATGPVDVQVTQPMVTLRNAALSSSFTPDSAGVLRGTGALTADGVLLGTVNSGMGQGNLTARSIAPAEVPPDVPAPDGGAPATPDGGTP